MQESLGFKKGTVSCHSFGRLVGTLMKILRKLNTTTLITMQLSPEILLAKARCWLVHFRLDCDDIFRDMQRLNRRSRIRTCNHNTCFLDNAHLLRHSLLCRCGDCQTKSSNGNRPKVAFSSALFAIEIQMLFHHFITSRKTSPHQPGEEARTCLLAEDYRLRCPYQDPFCSTVLRHGKAVHKIYFQTISWIRALTVKKHPSLS